jgi:bifunctional DNA-binding transcriptional regulator/antitoxin component of YhaV-PrlF toxin-antitoxin module
VKEIVTSITRRGQVTNPSEVRRLWGAKPSNIIAIQIEGD